MSKGLWKSIALLIVLVLMLSGCQGNSGDEAVSSETITYTWMVSEHPNNPVSDDWELFKQLEQDTNVAIKFQPVPEANYFEKRKLIIASGELPDLMTSRLSEANDYGPQGAYLPLNDYINTYGENIKKELTEDDLNSLKASDGNIYALPNITDGKTLIAWLVRQDILDELSITPGKTLEDFYNMLKKMKEKYPDSYPLAMRYSLAGTLANTWGIGDGIYFDESDKTFKFGAFAPEFKKMLQFFNKLYAEKLLDPEYATSASKQWEEKISNGKSFVTVDNFSRSDTFTNLMKSINPDFNLKIMLPPVTNANAKPIVTGANRQYTYTSISANVKNPEKLIEYIDYLYSKKGQEYYNWGIEGKTYTRVDGKITPLDALKNARTGTGEIELWRDLGAGPFIPTVEQLSETGEAYKFGTNTIEGVKLYNENVEYKMPAPNVAFTNEELNIINPINNNINDYMKKNIDKFIMNTFDDEEFDVFVNRIKEMGIEQVLEINNAAYERQY